MTCRRISLVKGKSLLQIPGNMILLARSAASLTAHETDKRPNIVLHAADDLS